MIEMDGYKALREGDLGEFDIIEGKRGLQADKVTLRSLLSLEPTRASNPSRALSCLIDPRSEASSSLLT